MQTEPTQWRDPRPTRFRLAGFGGAAVLLRTCVVAGVAFDELGPVLAMDIGFLGPGAWREVLERRIDPTLPARLSRFLFAAAEDFHPERSVAPLQDEVAGLVLTVESSADDRVCLDWSLAEDLDAEVRDFDGLNFETTRAALVAASHEALLLAGAGWTDREGVEF